MALSIRWKRDSSHCSLKLHKAQHKASSFSLPMMMLFLLPLLLQCSDLKGKQVYHNGALATASPIATRIGEDVFKQGGNAFDVAVAVGFALAVVHPQAGNIGGGGFAVIRDGKTGTIRSLDFREKAPISAHETMYLDSNGNVIENLSTVGALAVGVPGTVAGLYELWQEYGSMKWNDLVSISSHLADTGFILDQFQSNHLKEYQEKIEKFKESASLYFPGGTAFEPGERLTLKELGKTLALIADGGPDSFYTGSIADSLVATVTRHGGIITQKDLQDYSVVWREPISFQFDSFQVFSMPPPSSGGIVMGQMLKILERFDFSGYTTTSPEYIHLFCETARLAYADRSKHLGDADYYDVPDFLLNDEYLEQRASLINLKRANISKEIQPGEFNLNESSETTHYSIADSSGNLVAITYTLNSSYGCKLAVRGCGFLLNNEMDDFAVAPGHANLYGLLGGEANKVEPGKRMLSSMSPTIVMKGNKPFLILGSPGGSEIITAVTQTILNATRFGLSPYRSVSFPRFHHQWLPDKMQIEKKYFDENKKDALRKFGHRVEEYEPESEVQLVYVHDAGIMISVSDPRKNGRSGGF